jgi:hypothetical protein
LDQSDTTHGGTKLGVAALETIAQLDGIGAAPIPSAPASMAMRASSTLLTQHTFTRGMRTKVMIATYAACCTLTQPSSAR